MAPARPIALRPEEWIGGHGNVLKHVVLTTAIRELQKAHPEGLLVVDCLAGDGVFDLNQHPQPKNYRQGGVLAVLTQHQSDPENTPDAVVEWIQTLYRITGCTRPEELDVYPGAPIWVQHLLRPGLDEHRLLLAKPDDLLEIQWLQSNAQTTVCHHCHAFDVENSMEFLLPYTHGGKHPVLFIDPDYTEESDYGNAKRLLSMILDQCPTATVLVPIPLLQHHPFRWSHTTGLKEVAKRLARGGRYACHFALAKDGYQGDGVLLANPTPDLDEHWLNDHCLHWLAHVMNQGKDEYSVEQVMKKKKAAPTVG